MQHQSSNLVIKRREIPEFLLLITQRITKYPVLLERLLQHTDGTTHIRYLHIGLQGAELNTAMCLLYLVSCRGRTWAWWCHSSTRGGAVCVSRCWATCGENPACTRTWWHHQPSRQQELYPSEEWRDLQQTHSYTHTSHTDSLCYTHLQDYIRQTERCVCHTWLGFRWIFYS